MKAGLLGVLDEMVRGGNGSVRYGDLVRTLSESSSVPVEGAEFADAVRSLEQEGRVQVVGEGARRVVRRVTGAA